MEGMTKKSMVSAQAMTSQVQYSLTVYLHNEIPHPENAGNNCMPPR